MKEAERKESGFAPPFGDMDEEDFRRFGHAVIDWISRYFETIEKRPVLAQIKPEALLAQLPQVPPVQGESIEAILADVDKLIAPALTHWNHPSFFAYFATSTSAPGIFGELLSAAFDVKAMLWRTAPAAVELETVVLSWLRQMMNLPEDFQGLIYDTASVSSMTAIAAAREQLNLRIRELGMSGRTDLPLLRVYASEQAHSSIEKDLIALGLGQRALRKIPTDDEYRMDAEALVRAVEEDKQAGITPLCVVATIGTTSTASVDPVPAIADTCARHELWLHVDAAYAGSAAIAPVFRKYFAGCERADSLVTNPHKWLFTPFDLSVLYSRRMDIMRRAFSLVPEYLRTNEPDEVMNPMDYGVQLGRRFRALKLWMIIRYFGHSGLAARIREHCRLARLFASWIEESADWELAAPVLFGLVCFRAHPRKIKEARATNVENTADGSRQLDALNEQIMNGVNRTGEAFLSHTRLRDNAFTLRLAIGNIRTTEVHINRVWQLLNDQLMKLS
jgi:aromatic-L-amino-acid decarboxylase